MEKHSLDKDTQALCKLLIEKYKKTGDAQAAQRVRNELFSIILPYMQKWLKSTLAKRKIYLSPEMLLSACWEAFMYCLDTYNKLEVPMPSHFFYQINFFVLKCLQSKKKLQRRNEVPLETVFIDVPDPEDVTDPEDINPAGLASSSIISGMKFMKEFRDSLPEQYRMIFDDAITGQKTKMAILTGDDSKQYIPSYRYNEAKKIFQMLARFFFETIC